VSVGYMVACNERLVVWVVASVMDKQPQGRSKGGRKGTYVWYIYMELGVTGARLKMCWDGWMDRWVDGMSAV
jgi:hypothetical protein